jgi:hypothetical protein
MTITIPAVEWQNIEPGVLVLTNTGYKVHVEIMCNCEWLVLTHYGRHVSRDASLASIKYSAKKDIELRHEMGLEL